MAPAQTESLFDQEPRFWKVYGGLTSAPDYLAAVDATGAAPYVAGSATSHAAAAQIAPEAPNLRERVFAYIEAHGALTDEQIAAGTGLNPSTVRPRRVELARAGRIEVAGYSHTTSGRKAQAWRVTA